MTQQTAVEWLIKIYLQINKIDSFDIEQAKAMEKQQIINAFNQGERYGWDTQASIENIDEMRSKIPFISLEKYLEQFKKK